MSHSTSTIRRLPSLPDWATSTSTWLVASLACLLYMMWPAFSIRFGLIDDHEIVDMIGNRQRIPLQEIGPTVLGRTDEPLGRFRPVYWLGRTVEAATAGQDTTWWYVDRFVLAAVTLVAIYMTLVLFIKPPLAALVALLPFVGVQAEVWSRLGPSEAYAMPLLALGSALVVRKTRNGAAPSRQWLGYLLLVASGMAKENFIFPAVVIVAWSALHFGPRRWRLADWMVLSAATVLTVLDLIGIVIKVRNYGEVYEQERSFSTSRAWLDSAFANMDASSRFTAAVVAGLLLLVVLTSRPPRRVLVGLGLIVVLTAATQAVFYAGSPGAGRSYYPVVLLSVVAWGFTCYLLSRHSASRTRLSAAVVVALILAGPLLDGVQGARDAARLSADTTTAFQANLTSLEALIEDSGRKVVVMQPWESMTDIEPVLSLARYLSTRTDVTVMTLPAPQETEGYSADLNKMLRAWSRRGFNRLAAYQKPAPDECVSIVFGSATAECSTTLPPA